MLTISGDQRRARLARRHRLGSPWRASSVEEATESIVCLHATDPTSVYLSAWARIAEVDRADIDRALYVDRSVVKQMAMRRTLFAVPRGALAAVVHGPGARVAGSEARRLVRDVEKGGIAPDGERWLATAAAAVLDHLADGRDATWEELRDARPELAGRLVQGEGKSWRSEVPLGPRVLTVLSARGDVVRGANVATWMSSKPRWSAMTAWLGEPLPELEPPEARAMLVARWLRAFGPGTEQDITWWFGDTRANVRAALAAVQAVEVDLEGARGYVLPDDVDEVEPVEPWAALLPALDPATMGWHERDWYLGPHRSELFDTAGNGGTTVWWNGRIVGGWHQVDGGRVEVHLLEDIGRDGRRAVEGEVERLTAWLAGDAPGVRWPSPLVARLRRA